MKILHICKSDLPDYQNDMVFHGGRTLFGSNYVDANHIWYMYENHKSQYWNQRVPENGKAYGMGMTIHGKLDDINVDRNDISAKIKDKVFDYIVYGSITRCQDYLADVVKSYSKDRIILIDGEDQQHINYEFCKYGTVFKREMNVDETDEIHPINFAIPEELIAPNIPEKTQDWATVIPGQIQTYIFEDEKSYFDDYKKSICAMTTRKGGWDCRRHYEILMNGCFPYFPHLENCPKNTMANFPKEKIIEGNDIIQSGKLDMSWYTDTVEYLLSYSHQHLTTKAMFQQLLNKII